MGTLSGCIWQIRYSLRAVLNTFNPEISITTAFNDVINRVIKQTGNIYARDVRSAFA
jgi:hypothetical protein